MLVSSHFALKKASRVKLKEDISGKEEDVFSEISSCFCNAFSSFEDRVGGEAETQGG